MFRKFSVSISAIALAFSAWSGAVNAQLPKSHGLDSIHVDCRPAPPQAQISPEGVEILPISKNANLHSLARVGGAPGTNIKLADGGSIYKCSVTHMASNDIGNVALPITYRLGERGAAGQTVDSVSAPLSIPSLGHEPVVFYMLNHTDKFLELSIGTRARYDFDGTYRHKWVPVTANFRVLKFDPKKHDFMDEPGTSITRCGTEPSTACGR